jgi:hypothetical protein
MTTHWRTATVNTAALASKIAEFEASSVLRTQASGCHELRFPDSEDRTSARRTSGFLEPGRKIRKPAVPQWQSSQVVGRPAKLHQAPLAKYHLLLHNPSLKRSANGGAPGPRGGVCLSSTARAWLPAVVARLAHTLGVKEHGYSGAPPRTAETRRRAPCDRLLSLRGEGQ